MATFRLSFRVKVALIKEVKNYPVLWNGKHEKYGDRFCTASAWKNIAQKLKISENILRLKWKNLRNTFRITLKKTGITELEEYDGRWKLFHLLAFLKDEFKDEEEGSVEFIVETDQSEGSDNEPQVSNSLVSKIGDDDEPLTEDGTSEVSLKRNHEDKFSNDVNDTQSINDEEIIRRIDKREYDDNNHDREGIDEDNIPAKRPKISDRKSNYDVMFLRSLAPYFKQIDPLRKLVMRSRIQDLLLNEIAEQNSLNSNN